MDLRTQRHLLSTRRFLAGAFAAFFLCVSTGASADVVVVVAAKSSGASSSALVCAPVLETSGWYRLYAKWPAPSRTDVSSAPRPRVLLDIAFQGGARSDSSRSLNLNHNGGVWVYLGAYYFSKGSGNSIRLTKPAADSATPISFLFELSAAQAAPPAQPRPASPRIEYENSDRALNPAETLIVRTDSGTAGAEPAFSLRCDGRDFRLKGACGVEAIDEMAAAGANAVRSYSAAPPAIDDDVLRRASRAGVKILVGLNMAKPSGGFYRDPQKVASQHALLSAQIDRWKHYEAVLAWGIGNEIDPVTLSPEDARAVYAAIEALAAYARANDHYHPSVSIHAGSSPDKMRRIRELAPSIDIVACNSYAHVGNVLDNVKTSGWLGPYSITEYSINQPMEQKAPAGATPWGSVTEPLSRDKASRLFDIYKNHLAPHRRCLGGFVFKGAKGAFRVTHTWYPLLFDDRGTLLPTPSLDAMRAAWNDRPQPEFSAPTIDSFTVNGRNASDGVILQKNGPNASVSVAASAPSGSKLDFSADIRPDVSLKVNAPPRPLDHVAIAHDAGLPGSFRLRTADLPPGDYRLFITVRRVDPRSPAGFSAVGTANFPLRVR